jgi:hypothetical protein
MSDRVLSLQQLMEQYHQALAAEGQSVTEAAVLTVFRPKVYSQWPELRDRGLRTADTFSSYCNVLYAASVEQEQASATDVVPSFVTIDVDSGAYGGEPHLFSGNKQRVHPKKGQATKCPKVVNADGTYKHPFFKSGSLYWCTTCGPNNTHDTAKRIGTCWVEHPEQRPASSGQSAKPKGSSASGKAKAKWSGKAKAKSERALAAAKDDLSAVQKAFNDYKSQHSVTGNRRVCERTDDGLWVPK